MVPGLSCMLGLKKHNPKGLSVDFPRPTIGAYYAECCLLDLYQITTAADLADVEDRVALNDELGPLMVWPTLAAAVAALRGRLPPEDEAAQLVRLGWSEGAVPP